MEDRFEKYKLRICIYCKQPLKMKAAYYCEECARHTMISDAELQRLLNPKKEEFDGN